MTSSHLILFLFTLEVDKLIVLVTAERRKVDLDQKLKYLEIIVEHFFIIIILSILICKKRKQIDGQNRYTVGLEKYSGPSLRDQDQDRKYQDQHQDQDREKSASCALETKTAVSRTTSLLTAPSRN